MMPSLILPFADTLPVFAGAPVFAGSRSAVLGRATIGAGAWLGADSVVRADGEVVRIGGNVHLGPRATIHIVHETTPAIIGVDVTVGANAIVHACTLGDRCVIDDDVTILDDAFVEDDVLIEAGSTVFPRKKLETGWVYAGSPAKPVRRLGDGDLAARARAIRDRHGNTRLGGGSGSPEGSRSDNFGTTDFGTMTFEAMDFDTMDFGDAVFVARTARTAGRIACAPGASIFFSCVVDAGSGAISIGANTNVQDNTIVRAGSGETIIGRDTTIGHNVRMGSVRIGAEALVGIGSILADGTWVQDDVLLAAGSTTEPGQVLETGWMWGGRPARPMSALDAARREGMAANILTYCDYSQVFRRLQQTPG